MDAGLIVAIVVVVVLLIAVAIFMSPPARKARADRKLERRRTAVVEGHRQEATEHQTRAEAAEHQAARERAEAELHETRARTHEQGMADDELRATKDPAEIVARTETTVDPESPRRAETRRDEVPAERTDEGAAEHRDEVPAERTDDGDVPAERLDAVPAAEQAREQPPTEPAMPVRPSGTQQPRR